MAGQLNQEQRDWLRGLGPQIAAFLGKLARPGEPGRFLPCLQGATRDGRRAGLGYSCFALKLHYILGRWEALAPEEQRAWLDYIKSFQSAEGLPGEPMSRHAFLDPPVIQNALRGFNWRAKLNHRLRTPRDLTDPQRAIIAETKQAICTLLEVGAKPAHPYLAFPQSADGVKAWLERLPWHAPWGAGAQSCHLAAFIRTQGPARLEAGQVEKLCDEEYGFLAALVDAESGAYFQGGLPERGQLINGAMKVLTALDWLERPIHLPEKLIDTCLLELPPSEGCHLVDWVYVLYRCLQQTRHRLGEVQERCLQVLEMIRRHQNPDGGLSYYIGRAQVGYYGLTISKGLAESDMHGSLLLIWALSMIAAILDYHDLGWRVIKP
ncbi:hypothetical protein AAU61_00980 [Desulfocarbo indianensis]|nr:hypothetical protein AAU61_00980 [Desulfocarbo indianensis]